MFRNIFSKLPGFTNLSEIPVSTPCNSHMLRSLSPIKAEHRRRATRNDISRPYSRSYSFPSTRPKSYDTVRSGTCSAMGHNSGLDSRHLSSRNKQRPGTNQMGARLNQDIEEEAEYMNEDNKYDCYTSSEQYELETCKPRETRSQTGYNVFDNYEAMRDNDPIAYLQPSNLRPFGSMDNSYIPVSGRPTTAAVNPIEEDFTEDDGGRVSKKTNRDGKVQKREYSMKACRKTPSLEGLVQKLPEFEVSNASVNKRKLSTKFPTKKAQEQSENRSSLYRSTANCFSCNRGYVPPPKPAYSETLGNREEELSIDSRSVYGLHLPERTTSLDRLAKKSYDVLKYPLQTTRDSPTKPVLLCPDSMLLSKQNTPVKNIEVKKSLSSTALHRDRKITPIPMGVKNYSEKDRPPLEPESCEKSSETIKCFLPSRVRLKPPICTPKPKPCPKPHVCPPRSDDNAVFKVKPLSKIKTDETCPCIIPNVPTEIPKMKRLKFEFKDPPKICPIKGPECPDRADDAIIPKPKRLPRYVPKECSCVDAPPMQDVPLKRLEKVCEPPEVCSPVRVCPEPEVCVRADDGLEVTPKKLPPLRLPPCPCIPTPPQLDVPKMRRLKLDVPEPPRKVTPICVREVVCERADDAFIQQHKKLPKLVAGDCPCLDAQIEDAQPLKRLECIDEPEECPTVDPCIDVPRADMGCWEYWIPERRSKNKKCLDHNSKRKYNTDTRFGFSQQTEEVNRKSEENLTNEIQEEKASLKKKEVKSKAYSTPTIDLLIKLKDLDRTSRQINKNIRHPVLSNNLIQVQNVRNLCSKVKQPHHETTTTKKKEITDKCVRKSKCSNIDGKCPKFHPPIESHSEVDLCDRRCKHVPPKVVCNRQTSPYPAFSDLLDDDVQTFANKTECKTDRGFDFHLEEKKQIVAQKPNNKNNTKCFSTLARSKECSTITQGQTRQIHRCYPEENEFSETKLDGKDSTYQAEDSRSVKVNSFNDIYPDHSSHLIWNHPKLQKFGLGKQKSEKVNLKPLSFHVIQPRRSESNFTKKFETDHSKRKDNNKKDHKKDAKKQTKIDNKNTGERCKKYSFCPKMQIQNCEPPAKRLPSCRKVIPVICQKKQAPFRAFSDCLQGELAEDLSECPLEAEKKRELQPDYVKTLDHSKLMQQPIQPRVGKLDLTAEDECVRRRLCLDKQGLSESCACFGKKRKPLRARDIPNIREQLKNQNDEKHVYHNQTARTCKRKFCTYASDAFLVQKRGMCNLLRPDTPSEANQKRNYHLLCKTKERHLEQDTEEKKFIKDHEDAHKNKVGSVRWRLDNFQKWHRLNKLNSHSTFLKKYYSSPDILRIPERVFSSAASNAASYHTIEEDRLCRHISTSNTEYATKSSVGPKKNKFAKNFNENIPKPECPFKCMNLTPECDYRTQTFNNSTKTICEPYPDVGVVDYNLGREYMRHKYGIKNEGITQDCETFGTTLTCKDRLFKKTVAEEREDPSKREDPSYSPQECETDEKAMWVEECPNSSENSKTHEDVETPRVKVEEPSVKVEGPCQSSKAILPVVKPDGSRERLVYKECLPRAEPIKSHSDGDIPSRRLNEPHESRPEEYDQILDKKENSVWQKIVNYFKARPGCPAPDEWKKKALREKAEKAAKAAGLALCDPKDLEKLKDPQYEELPEVITPADVERRGDQDDPRPPRKQCLDHQKRNFTTSVAASNHIYCDPLYIGQYLNKVITTVPLDLDQVNLIGCCRFPKMLSCHCNFPWKKLNSQFLKNSSSVESKRFYSKCTDRKELEDVGEAKEENKKLNNVEMNVFGDGSSGKCEEEKELEKVSKAIECYEKSRESDTEAEVVNYPNRYFPKKISIFDLIFPEVMTDNPEYHQAKALAAFQEIFNQFDAYSDINIEELENLKTEAMLKELDKLLDDQPKPKEE